LHFREERDFQDREFQETKMSGTRRRFFQDAAIFSAGLLGLSKSIEAQAEKPMQMRPREAKHAHTPPAGTPLPVMTPDVADLPQVREEGLRLQQSRGYVASNTFRIRLRNDFGVSYTSVLPALGSASEGLRILSETWSSPHNLLSLKMEGRVGHTYELFVWEGTR